MVSALPGDVSFLHCLGFVTNRRLLLSGSGLCLPFEAEREDLLSPDAMGRVLYSWKDLQDLAGYTARVSELMDTMSDIRTGNFKKSLIASASSEENAKRRFIQHKGGLAHRLFLVLQSRGKVFESEEIKFEGVPIITPNGDVLVRSLSFYVKRGVSFPDPYEITL